jgi:phosphate transport system substrate-binding protein
MTRRRRRVGAIVVAGLACLTAASAIPAGADAKSQLQGEGESWPVPMLEQLQNTSSKEIAPLDPGYVDVGDEQAREDVADGDVDYASVGEPFTADELATAKQHGRSIAYVPYAYGAVAIAFAIDVDGQHGGGTVANLKLTNLTLAKMFAHQVPIWADPEILAENNQDPALANPKVTAIISVTRLDSSWSTAALINYFLADPASKPVWNAYATGLASPADTPLDRWPADTFSGTAGIISGSKGVIDTMLQLDPATGVKKPSATTHHLAYLAPAWTTKYNAPVAAIQNKAGQFVTPTAAGVQKAVEQAGTVDPKTNLITLDFNKITDATAYPIPMVEYLAVPTTGLSGAKANALSKFVKYTLGDAGQKVVADTGYVPVSQELRTSGLKVAAALAATANQQAVTTTTAPGATTTSKPGVSTTTTTDTTPTSGAAVDPGGGGSVDNSGGGSALPFTGGGPPAPVVIIVTFVLVAAALGRRHARRARA